jgi:hypothetical protein
MWLAGEQILMAPTWFRLNPLRVVWKRRSGAWKLHDDIWNSDVPPPAA